MHLKKLIKVLCELQGEGGMDGKRGLPYPYILDLLAEPTIRQLAQLQSGSGNPIAEMCQINSSAGMAFNFYKLLEEASGMTVDFEWKESIPLLKSLAPANIDVRYEAGDTIYFAECKFLEPYYSNCERNNAAYFDMDRYPIEDNKDRWLALFKTEAEFRYYNVAQLYRHLLAIYRHLTENPDIYKRKQIVLQSVVWRMTEKFKEKYRLTKKDKERVLTIEEESKKAEGIIKLFFDDIGWDNIRYESVFYNDILDQIKEASRYETFIKQYILD